MAEFSFNIKKYKVGSKNSIVPTCKQCGAVLPLDVVILFCSECGQSINIRGKALKLKTDLETLNMKEHLFLTFIPFLNIFPAYKLGKFKYSLGRLIPDVLLLLFLLIWSVTPLHPFFSASLIIVLWIIPSMVMLYFIRRLTVEWNNRVEFLESLQSKTD